jgi:hypothetical protein
MILIRQGIFGKTFIKMLYNPNSDFSPSTQRVFLINLEVNLMNFAHLSNKNCG